MEPLGHSLKWKRCADATDQAKFRLCCFPYVGGDAMFGRWKRHGMRHVEIYAIGMSETNRPEIFSKDICEFASLTASLMDASPSPLPLAFFGHSLGALLAFETARALQHVRLSAPLHLFVSGCAAPRLFNSRDSVSHLPDDAFMERLNRFRSIPTKVLASAEYMEVLIPILRAHYRLLDTYRYRESDPLVCPISAYVGADDPEVSQFQLAMWRSETRGKFTIQTFHGEHFYFEPDPKSLLDAITLELSGQEP